MLYENIHPFSDGNGRSGRNILNYLLLKDGYLAVVFRYDKEHSYLNALGQWQIEDNPVLFMTQITDNLTGELQEHSKILDITENGS